MYGIITGSSLTLKDLSSRPMAMQTLLQNVAQVMLHPLPSRETRSRLTSDPTPLYVFRVGEIKEIIMVLGCGGTASYRHFNTTDPGSRADKQVTIAWTETRNHKANHQWMTRIRPFKLMWSCVWCCKVKEYMSVRE